MKMHVFLPILDPIYLSSAHPTSLRLRLMPLQAIGLKCRNCGSSSLFPFEHFSPSPLCSVVHHFHGCLSRDKTQAPATPYTKNTHEVVHQTHRSSLARQPFPWSCSRTVTADGGPVAPAQCCAPAGGSCILLPLHSSCSACM